MTLEEQVRILAVITTRDETGRHFLERHRGDDIAKLEAAGLVAINRPVHSATGIPYSPEYYTIEVTEEGQALVDAHPDLWPKECE